MTAKLTLATADKYPVVEDLDISEPSVRAANACLTELGARGGFDGWFDDIDEETKLEIVLELSGVIEEVYPKPRQFTEEEIQVIADKALKRVRANFEHLLNQPVKDYCVEQGYVVTPQNTVTSNQSQGNRAMSDIKQNVIDLAVKIEAQMNLGEAGIVEVPKTLYADLLPEALTAEVVKVYQDHTSDLVAATAEALANIAIPAFKADPKLEQLSVEFGCGSDSLAGTIQRSKDYPAGGIPKEGETRDPNATITKYGIVSMKYGVNAHANKGSLKKVRDGINKRAAEALANA